MKRLLVAIVAALAALAVAAPAMAHNANATITCEAGTLTVTFNYGQFPSGSSTTSQETVTVNGTQAYSQPFSFTGDNASHPITLSPFSGAASVTAAWDFTSQPDGFHASGSTTEQVDCGTPQTTGGDTGGDTGGTTGDTTTGGTTTGGTTTGGGTTGSGGVIGSTTGGTTGGSPGAETGGELPFTGLPVWIPVLLAFALLASGGFLLRRKRDDVS